MNAYLILTLSSVFFGGTWVAGHVAVEGLPPMTIASVRFLIASLILYGWARLQEHPRRRITARDLPLILTLGASAIAIYNVLFLYGLRLAPASDGAIIVPGLAPVFTVLLAWPILRERVGLWAGAGFAVAMVAFVFFYEGVKRIGAGPASAFAFLVPVIGVVSSVILLGERLAPGTVLGGALVLLGLWLVQRDSRLPAPGPAAAPHRP